MTAVIVPRYLRNENLLANAVVSVDSRIACFCRLLHPLAVSTQK